jgi:hypothetical protein
MDEDEYDLTNTNFDYLAGNVPQQQNTYNNTVYTNNYTAPVPNQEYLFQQQQQYQQQQQHPGQYQQPQYQQQEYQQGQYQPGQAPHS